jgi:capsule biosynthesis phosphatase
MKTIVFDLDDTICFPDHSAKTSYEKYGLAKPNTEVIKEMQKLHEMNYHIIICSARRMVTHSGDVKKIVADIGDITINWLAEHFVQYDEIQYGKPYSDTYYVDDKGMNLQDFIKWTRSL